MSKMYELVGLLIDYNQNTLFINNSWSKIFPNPAVDIKSRLFLNYIINMVSGYEQSVKI